MRGKGFFLCVIAVGFMAACTRPAQDRAADAVAEEPAHVQGDSIDVSGVLIDSRCFALDKENVTNDHARPEGQVRGVGCGGACARQGFPVAVLEDGDPAEAVWVLSFPPPVFADYIGETVRVLGDYRAPGIIIPLRVEYQNGDTWSRIM